MMAKNDCNEYTDPIQTIGRDVFVEASRCFCKLLNMKLHVIYTCKYDQDLVAVTGKEGKSNSGTRKNSDIAQNRERKNYGDSGHLNDRLCVDMYNGQGQQKRFRNIVICR